MVLTNLNVQIKEYFDSIKNPNHWEFDYFKVHSDECKNAVCRFWDEETYTELLHEISIRI